jgi:hypothetical protein
MVGVLCALFRTSNSLTRVATCSESLLIYTLYPIWCEEPPMVAHLDGRYICNQCGHTTRPGDPIYECHCSGCVKLMAG